MCGIAGYLNSLETPAESALLSRMAATLAHRGPDATGMFTAPGLGLAHARLSIVDIAGGAQPMSLPDGGPVISFNGEYSTTSNCAKTSCSGDDVFAPIPIRKLYCISTSFMELIASSISTATSLSRCGIGG